MMEQRVDVPGLGEMRNEFGDFGRKSATKAEEGDDPGTFP